MANHDQTNALLEKTSEFNLLYKRITEQLLAKINLSSSAINLIKLLGDQELTLTEVTKSSRLDKSTVSRQMNALVKKEYVAKTTGKDKRFAYFTLTDNAREVYDSYQADLEEQFNTILSGWTEEEIHMLTVLIGRLNRSVTNRLGS